MGRTLPPRVDVSRTPVVRATKLAKRDSAGTTRSTAARGRTGQHPEVNPTAATGKTAPRRGDRPSRTTSSHRTAAERDLARRMLEALKAGSDVRSRKVRRLKAAIKVRAYENDLKFQVALERMTGTTGR
jgi:hypothetical protein